MEQRFVGILSVLAALMIMIMTLLVALLFAFLVGPWIRGFLGGAPVTIIQLLGMRLRGTPPGLIVDALVTLVHRGHPHDSKNCRLAESTWLAQRGLIRSPEHLADLVEKQLQAKGKSG